MKIVIPVAGIGSRLRPHTYNAPKVLLEVAGKPILGHIVTKLIADGATEIILITGYLGQMIKSYLEIAFPNFSFKFVEQVDQLGLGHAVWLSRGYFTHNQPIFIALGDTIFNADLNTVFKNKYSMLGVRPVDNPSQFGIVELRNDQIKHLVEKPANPKSNLALVGLYSIKNSDLLFSSLDFILDNNLMSMGEFQLTDALQIMIEKGETFFTFPVHDWYDCGKSDAMLQTNKELLNRSYLTHPVFENVLINSPVFIDQTAKIENSIIGPYATISKHVCIIDSVISDSIISENSYIESVMLTHSIVGKNAKIVGSSRQINIGDSSDVKL